ncbi:MAG: tetratricopeptide repeat protein [Nitrosomonas sp.]|nr:tetratricopeptide repeat protein [Nitrosomonas sp.]MDP1951372.1 tetratricopeptide repeat protein [Nitrosomonas sp.]
MTNAEIPQQTATLIIDQALQQAIAYHQAGQLRDAERLYRAILQIRPDHADVHHNLDLLAQQIKQATASLPDFKAALEANPDQGQYWLNYIDALMLTGQVDVARQVLQQGRQRGLQGDAVEVLAGRLERIVQLSEQESIKESQPDASAVAQGRKTKSKRKLPKPEQSTKKPVLHKGMNPSAQQIETLVALFTEGRYTEVITRALQMTEYFPWYGFGWKILGAGLKQTGQTTDALYPMQKAVELLPTDSETHNNLGITLQDLGRPGEAEACFRQALEINRDYAEAHLSLGNILQVLGQLDEAATSCRRALEIRSNYTPAYLTLGNILRELGQLEQAVTCYQRALEIKPDYVEAFNNLGNTLQELGRLDEAVTCCRRALEIKPDHASAYLTLGSLFLELGRPDEAEASFRRLLEIKPDDAPAYLMLGNVLDELGRLNEAEVCCNRALEIKPDYAPVYLTLGYILQKLGRLDEAEANYRRALEINPDYAGACNNLGNTLKEQGRLDEAEIHLLRALEIRPDYVEAHNNLGVTLKDLGRLDEAEAHFHRALELKPDYVEAHNNLGATLKDLGRLDEAEDSYRQVLQLKPDYEIAFDSLLFTLNYHPDKSGEEIFAVYREYDARHGLPFQSEWRVHGNSRETQRRLKVGYVSPDFKKHSVQNYLEPLLAHHDKQFVEVYAYAELAREDSATVRFKHYVDQWIPTRGMSDDALAERIRADGIDILVDLADHTGKNRLKVFARKPAPVSVSWLGYGYTTGLTAIDYYLTDLTTVPEGCDVLFSETPWRLATPSFSYRPAENMGAVSVLPALAKGYITFGTLTRPVRINHRTIRVWSEILNRVKGARLVIDSKDFSAKRMQDILVDKFAAHGIERERLEIGYHSPPWDVLRGIDIGLDCFPHNSGATLFETLYMGVPYITLAGRPSVGRLGSCVLQGVGHPEWITENEDDYVAKAVALASDVTHLSVIRAVLRDQMERSPLRDEAGFALKVEDAYRRIWKIWCEKGNKT